MMRTPGCAPKANRRAVGVGVRAGGSVLVAGLLACSAGSAAPRGQFESALGDEPAGDMGATGGDGTTFDPWETMAPAPGDPTPPDDGFSFAGMSGTLPLAGAGGVGGSAGIGGTGGTAGTGGTGGTAGTEPPPFDPSCPRTYGVPGSVRSATRKIKDLTGNATSSGQFGVGGTDLGIAVRQPDGKIAYVFGDTFEQDTVGGPGWRAPVLLRSEPGLEDGGIVFTSAAGGSYAKQLLSYSHDNGRTFLPSDAITIGDRMYLHFIVNEGLGNVAYSEIAYSDDNGENWTPSGVRWLAGENDSLQQLWTWELGCDGYVYVLSTKFISRDRAIILHRVPEESLLDKNAYEPWGYAGGQWAWGNPPTIVLDGQFGEMSLRRVEDKWVLAWFNAGQYRISIKVFDSPTSNLITATTYHPILGGEWGAENDTHVAQLYGGYIHPDSTLHELHLIVSQWNTQTNWPYRAMQFVTGVE